MPGGASNTGADWVVTDFGKDLQWLNEAAASLIPTGLLAWPLKQTGERFPFVAPQAQGFMPAETLPPAQRFAACMEGVAFIDASNSPNGQPLVVVGNEISGTTTIYQVNQVP